MTTRPTLRQWLLIAGAALWLVLLVYWYVGPGEPGALQGMSWLTVAIVLLPLLIAYELSTMATRWLRRRRGGRFDA